MIDSHFWFNNENYKEIDDIIDARKKLGQYNVFNQMSSAINYRFAYSSSVNDRYVRFDDAMIINDGDYPNTSLRQTDSEITIVRVKCNGLPKRRRSKWDMNDVAIPGDGSHLGESPSLVNLATLVAQTSQNIRSEHKEYLVPLSSWDPYYKTESENENEDMPNECWVESGKSNESKPLGEEDSYLDSSEDNTPAGTPTTSSFASSYLESVLDSSDYDLKSTISRRPSLAGRISNFIRKRCKRSKTLPSLNYEQEDECKQ